MKIALAQLNGTVGDFPANAKRILNAYREGIELGADLVLTPEMSLVGYPPRDLILKSQFVTKCLQALDYLASEIGEIPLLVGYVDNNEGQTGKPYRNAAAFLHQGKLHQKIYKTLLPTYDVFDERRYYHPAETTAPIHWNGRKLGVTICEDIWTQDYLHRPLYQRHPVQELLKQGADIILNLSASPFHIGKIPTRRSLITHLARQHKVPIAYCNSIGGNDQLIFDGHSLAANEKGQLLGQLSGFKEEVKLIDLTGQKIEPQDPSEDESLYHALTLGLRDYAHKCGFQKACLGLSGGIDSALTAALAAAALGPENIHGLTMPSHFSSTGSVHDSYALAKNLGIRCDTLPIKDTFDTVKQAMIPAFDDAKPDVTEENMQARIRGLYLMSLSNKTGSLLLTTGNKSELAVGYCTMYGDMCGGIAPINDLPKMKVYSLSRWINRQHEIIPTNTIEKEPSAELAPNQRDQDTLPPYPILDHILELYIEQQLSSQDIIATTDYDEATIHWITRRVDINEWKRHQAPPGLRVTSKAFGIGRRLPIVQKFPG